MKKPSEMLRKEGRPLPLCYVFDRYEDIMVKKSTNSSLLLRTWVKAEFLEIPPHVLFPSCPGE